jgi:anti-sigma B factor antagonist
MAYTLEHDPIDTGHIVYVTGELDISAIPELSTVLAVAAAAPGATVVLDLGGVDFVDSTALGTILKAGGEIESAGKRLVVVCAHGPVRRLLEMTNLTQRFHLSPTRKEALGTAGRVRAARRCLRA